jgi:hypothetical protein
MIKNLILFSGVLALLFFAAGIWPSGSAAQDFTCEIKADNDNLHVYIRDFDRDGNPTRRVIYRGWIMQGKRIPIVSRSGRISVNFKADSAKRGSGSNELTCRNNRIHSLP